MFLCFFFFFSIANGIFNYLKKKTRNIELTRFAYLQSISVQLMNRLNHFHVSNIVVTKWCETTSWERTTTSLKILEERRKRWVLSNSHYSYHILRQFFFFFFLFSSPTSSYIIMRMRWIVFEVLIRTSWWWWSSIVIQRNFDVFVLLILPTLMMFVCFENDNERERKEKKVIATVTVHNQAALNCNTISLPFLFQQ